MIDIGKIKSSIFIESLLCILEGVSNDYILEMKINEYDFYA